MNNYFNIEPITINSTPFESKTGDAIEWNILNLGRGDSTAACVCMLINTTEGYSVYTWTLEIPQNILSQWLDDSIIDDFIIASSNGVFTKK